jgi:hypothetical protein
MIKKEFFLFLIKVVHVILALDCSFGSVSNGQTCDKCGVSDEKANVKIVGGKVA